MPDQPTQPPESSQPAEQPEHEPAPQGKPKPKPRDFHKSTITERDRQRTYTSTWGVTTIDRRPTDKGLPPTVAFRPNTSTDKLLFRKDEPSTYVCSANAAYSDGGQLTSSLQDDVSYPAIPPAQLDKDDAASFANCSSPFVKLLAPMPTGKHAPRQPLHALIDTGANASLISPAAAARWKLKQIPLTSGVSLCYGNETEANVETMCRIDGFVGSHKFLRFRHRFLVVPLPEGIDAFIGADFCRAYALELHLHNGTLRYKGKRFIYEPGVHLRHKHLRRVTTRTGKPVDPDKPLPVEIIGSATVDSILRQNYTQPYFRQHQVWMVHLRPREPPPAPPPSPSVETAIDELDVDVEIKQILKRHLDVFPNELPREPPPDRDVFHRIPVSADHQPFSRSPYRMSPHETEALRKQVQDLVADGKIKPSTSSYGAPALFVRKSDGSLRLCIDYRRLNSETVKDKYPLPHMHDLLDRLATAKFFTVMDLRSGFWQVPLHPDDTHRTAFTTPFGLYEWVVMPFGLTSAPATFQRLVNTCLTDCNHFVQAYLDDFIIFSDTMEEHLQHIERVLQRLSKHKLYVKLSKCQFAQEEVEYVGHIVGKGQVKIQPSKIDAICKIKEPQNKHDVQVLLGLVNWIRRFLPNLAHHLTPLTNLLKKDKVFEWGEKEAAALQKIKDIVTRQPVLALPKPDKPFLLQTDASDYALGGTLLQQDDDGKYHTVAFESKRFNSAQTNYDVRDKELLAIVHCLKTWRHLLLGTEFDIQTDHRTLTSLQKQTNIKPRHARWMELIGEFGELSISHISGPDNGLADALSRMPSDNLTASNTVTIHAVQARPCTKISIRAVTLATLSVGDDLIHRIKQAYQADPACQALLDVNNNRYKTVNGLIYFSPDADHNKSSRLMIPKDDRIRTTLLEEAHEPKHVGHRGKHSTYATLHRLCYWSGMLRDVQDFVSSCSICLRNRSVNRRATGNPQPLEIPPHNWHTITMDFAVGLPKSPAGNDSVLVVVDKLSKRKHLIPCRSDASAVDIAEAFYSSVFKLHGVPCRIVSDRDPKFTSRFWTALADMLGTKLKMSTASHPQSDGQSENAVKQMKDALRNFLSYDQDDWESTLPAIEFAMNSTRSASTGYTPFELDTGYLPLEPLSTMLQEPKTEEAKSARDFVEHINDCIQDARDQLAIAQDRQSKVQEKKSQPNPFKTGDWVLVQTGQLQSATQRGRPSKKLQTKYTGPFQVTQVNNSQSCTLHLTKPYTKAHPTLNVKHLKKFVDSPPRFNTRRQSTGPDPVDFDDDDNPLYLVEDILDCRTYRRKLQYLVKWKGYDHSENSWEPASQLPPAVDPLIQRYHDKHG
eukprot:TRINITY_DN12614_c0_g2_i1.p1 TRINITY_DN12614_c0_g2~~TRINITY_DN12614_c0_g2_i1.p1  ORF type:complete len:1337 (+),score=253.89 TRINITY_DN12614_c0_g2_i1:1150-5160(+)